MPSAASACRHGLSTASLTNTQTAREPWAAAAVSLLEAEVEEAQLELGTHGSRKMETVVGLGVVDRDGDGVRHQARRQDSLCIQLIQSAEICLGQTASHSRLLLQLPKPS